MRESPVSVVRMSPRLVILKFPASGEARLAMRHSNDDRIDRWNPGGTHAKKHRAELAKEDGLQEIITR